MTAERYQQVELLFHEALEQPAEERDSFVDRACGGDDELRREVQSLLASDFKASQFIEEPPGEIAAALLADETHGALLGHTLAHYQVLSKLGTGGMGEVYLATDTKLGRKVAMKLLHQKSLADERARKRLIREAQAAARLDHPNICAIHEVGEGNGYDFIVMQYVEGETLSEKIRNSPLEISTVVGLAVQVADALAEAHSRGITHRDIKPQNIMVTSREHAKVMDFGLARVADEQAIKSESEESSSVTEPGVIKGTIPYMSPEQVKGDQVDAQSDIFSFGAVLYEITTGKNPFRAASAAETISAILTRQPPPLAEHAGGVPEGLQRIVDRCLEKDKEQRYQKSSDLLIDLRKLNTDIDSGAAIRNSVVKPRSRNRIIAAVGFVVVALASTALYSLLAKAPPASKAIHSLAILPFVNAGDASAEYLSDGITESLINSLSQLSQLKVIARTTAFRYKGKDADPRVLGRELNVNAVITGRVIQQGDNLIVQADLISAADGSQIWGARYTQKLSEVFAVQEQIAREIAGNLRFKLTGKETRALSKRYTENIKAYQDYSIGLTYLQRRTRRDFFTAISYFEKAIGEESNYALAHAALTEAYASVTIRSLIEPTEGRRKTEDSARRAISLDPNLAEAHAAVSQPYLYFPPYDFSAGEREVRYAIELNPGLAHAYLALGAALLEQGRLDEALEVWSKGRELDPLSPIIARLEAYTYLQMKNYPRALELLRASRELGPPFVISAEVEMYTLNGAFDEVLSELEKIRSERGEDPIVAYSEGVIAAAQGRRSEARRIIRELERTAGPGRRGSVLIAMTYCVLNEKELALDWLERGLEAGAITVFYNRDPVWDILRDEPRFQTFLGRIGVQG
jgi:serine/threonine protein kinase/tetratricopeptide (TPR) repeat protein